MSVLSGSLMPLYSVLFFSLITFTILSASMFLYSLTLNSSLVSFFRMDRRSPTYSGRPNVLIGATTVLTWLLGSDHGLSSLNRSLSEMDTLVASGAETWSTNFTGLFDPTSLLASPGLFLVLGLSLIAGMVNFRPDASEHAELTDVELSTDIELSTEFDCEESPPANHDKAGLADSHPEIPEYTQLVAHELQTALQAIHRLVEVGELSNPSPIQSSVLSGIRQESEVLDTLFRDLQSISHINQRSFTVRRRVCKLGQLLRSVKVFAQSLAGSHNVILSVENDDTVLADPERITQVLRNLLYNAAKYSPADSNILIRATRHSRVMLIEVVDEGNGIHPDEIRRIFGPFERGTNGNEEIISGMGLGLYISQRIVGLHGSRLRARNLDGAGSVFSFSLEVCE